MDLTAEAPFRFPEKIASLGPEVGYQVQTDDRSFDGITADIKDSERAVWITFGSKPVISGVRSCNL
jgi:hypothetical protein